MGLLETLDVKYTNLSDLLELILEAENLRYLYTTEVVLDVAACHQLESKKSLNRNIQTVWASSQELRGLRKLALKWRGSLVSEATKHILNLKMLDSLRLQLRHPSSEISDMSKLKSLSNFYLLSYLGMQSSLESRIPPNGKY